ncbi:MAG: MBL fold metallo-hydrolase [Desulfobacterales bacterium]|nr:MBL fold metallo-hydrolase [Desulfobacterales bacterium]
MEIVQNLWQVGGSDLTAPEDAAIYLVRSGEQAALIDAGCGNDHERLVENISSVLAVDVTITYLFLTHCHYDHVGGAAALKEQYGCKIVAHQLDAAYLEAGDSGVTAASWYGTNMKPLTIDHKIEGHKKIFNVGKQAVFAYHCPGHSPGSLVYLVKLENQKILFGQDVHGPLDPSLLSDREDYIRSLKFVMGLKADILCEGHFGIYKGSHHINKFIQSFL